MATDALTFARRAATLGDGAVRFTASDGLLTLTCAPLAPRGLLDSTPTILGMRVMRIDPELVCDLSVEGSSLRIDTPGDLVLPETAVSPPWAGVTPGRDGWTADGSLSAATLATRAQWGIAAVASALPDNPGEDVVKTVRASVWSPADAELGGLPLGVAFAAFALGFIAGEESAHVFASDGWARISLTRGHILVRRPKRARLTDVRATGSVPRR